MQLRGEGIRERVRWSSCGLIVGLVVGVFLGWVFNGILGTLFRVVVVLLFLTPFVAALVFWMSNRRTGGGESSAVQEARWRDLGGPGGNGS